MNTMTDKELLEAAAKAAEIEVSDIGDEYWPRGGVSYWQWNPLTDDGDALRLAVKLNLLVNIDETESQATDGKGADECEIHKNSDPYAAIRRAIVRAAAEIGGAL